MKLFVSIIFCVYSIGFVRAQKAFKHNAWSRSEFGLLMGGSYYLGDLNKSHLANTNLAGQAFYRYNIHSRLAFRANITIGKINAADETSSNAYYVNRNLSFQTNIYEFGTGVEFTYLPFEIGSKRYRGTAYLLAELAVARINPTTEWNGEQVELQPLGTEGQGTSMSDRSKYTRTQLAIPLGIGCRFTLTENIGLNLEYGLRFLFTDYIDDVGSYRYVDPVALQAENGPMAAALSNRSLDQNQFGQRGNPSIRDWYAFFGAGISFRLGGKNPCPSDL